MSTQSEKNSFLKFKLCYFFTQFTLLHKASKLHCGKMGSIVSLVSDAPRQPMANVPPEYEDEMEMKKAYYMNLPSCPVPYHHIHREANRILNQWVFEGMRCRVQSRVGSISDRLMISHKFSTDQVELPYYAPEICKAPTADYEFGASFTLPKLLLVGKIDTNRTLKGRARFNHADRFSCDVYGELPTQIYWAYGKLFLDYKGNGFQSRFQVETIDKSCNVNYIQNVMPNLSLGGQLSWLGEQNRPVAAFAARYGTNRKAAGEVTTDGSIALSYVHPISKKVSVASNFHYDRATKYYIGSIGYQYKFREAVLRGKVNSNGAVSSHIMKKLGNRARLVLVAELDHARKNYRCGYGLEWGALPVFPNESGLLQ